MRTAVSAYSLLAASACALAAGACADEDVDVIDNLPPVAHAGLGGTAMRGMGKTDARSLAESQRLSAELSKTQEELERAKTSADDNALLRREPEELLAARRQERLVRRDDVLPPLERALHEIPVAREPDDRRNKR